MNPSLRTRIIGAFAAIYLMWGGTFLAIRYAVVDVPPLMTMVLRCAGGQPCCSPGSPGAAR